MIEAPQNGERTSEDGARNNTASFFFRAGHEPPASLTTFSLSGSLWYTAEAVEEEIDAVNKKEKKWHLALMDKIVVRTSWPLAFTPPTTASCSALLV